jgi:urease accessory protein
MSDENNSWLVWQLADSAFPAGGFAHSGGMEAAWQHGEIRNADELESFLESSLWQIACGVIPFVTAAYDAPDQIVEWNLYCDAFLSNHVANRASRVQGRAFLNTAARVFGDVVKHNQKCDLCHFAPVFGWVMRSLSVTGATAVGLFLFMALRGQVAAAVRLGIAGPMEAQAIQNRLAPRAREILMLTADREVEEIATTSPLMEIWQGGHDRLYSRLFQT